MAEVDLIKAKYYDYKTDEKGQSQSIYPQILKLGFMSVAEKFGLAIYIDPGVLQLCDPFTLQPFIALTVSTSTYSFLDHFLFHKNMLIGYNERQLVVVELDHDPEA